MTPTILIVLYHKIKQVIDVYKLLLSFAFTNYYLIYDVNVLSDMWPELFKERINKQAISH